MLRHYLMIVQGSILVLKLKWTIIYAPPLWLRIINSTKSDNGVGFFKRQKQQDGGNFWAYKCGLARRKHTSITI